MKVKELIEALLEMDPEHMVIVDGYEGGVKEASHIQDVIIALNVNQEWYYGPHEEVSDEEQYEGHARAQAVRIF